ncbi:MAG: GAP family protein, partial [Mycobacterium sp.]|uniref:GAP family protein n=1 Tax=Mycobacterium sp. TaxID=1785 RepID=UPI003F964744
MCSTRSGANLVRRRRLFPCRDGSPETDSRPPVRQLHRGVRASRVTSSQMWIYVLYMGFALALDPFRLGFALVLTSRRRPMLNLFAFWLGGMAAGLGLAMFGLLL